MEKLLKVWCVIVGVTSLLALISIIALIVLVFAINIFPFRGEDFSPEIWAAAMDCKTDKECAEKHVACVRGAMYSDLVYNHLSTGTDEATMVSLLGPYQVHQRNTSCVEYELGVCSGFIDSDYMVVCFDKQRKIIDVSKYQR